MSLFRPLYKRMLCCNVVFVFRTQCCILVLAIDTKAMLSVGPGMQYMCINVAGNIFVNGRR